MHYMLKTYLKLLQQANLVKSCCLYGKKDQMIENLTFDSRETMKRGLFICKGAAFKPDYLSQAFKNGAVCYIAEEHYPLEYEVPYILVKDIRKAMPVLAKQFYQDPARELDLVGITGTKGKTTTSYYIKAIMDEYSKSVGLRSMGIISSIEIKDGVEHKSSSMTTPESLELYRHMRNAVASKKRSMVMEVSSQALKYQRVRGLNFDVGVFLNISEDHISPAEHDDFEDYFSAKLSIFRQCETACINLDSDKADRILQASRLAKSVITFGTGQAGQICGSVKNGRVPDILGYDIQQEKGRIHFRVKSGRFDEQFTLAMPGVFNVENALAAISVAYLYRIPVEYMIAGLKKAKVKGRMEQYVSSKRRLTVIVDYAHNRLSFEKLFQSVLMEHPFSKIVSVFGCPGNKAYNRRKDLGLIAGLYSKKVYLAADDPGEEQFVHISGDIARYVESVGCPYECIENRGDAIKRAIEEAEEESVVLVLGKGCESHQKIGKVSCAYPTDANFVKKYL